MADIPRSWEAYARLQHRLSSTNSIVVAASLEEAANVVHKSDFDPECTTQADIDRMASSAGRQERHRALLRRRVQDTALDNAMMRGNEDDDGYVGSFCPRSLDDVVHARRELSRIERMLPNGDWELLIDMALGASYADLANQHGTTSSALRSRVCRLRQVIH